MTRVTYLGHDGYVLTTPSAILVFDYFTDPDKKLEKVLGESPELPVVFLVTHHHKHFDTSIFELAQNRRRTYVLSSDILSRHVPEKGLSVAWLAGGDAVDSIDGLAEVRAIGKGPGGVSYGITLPDNRKIFFAGDLDVWKWTPDPDEKTAVKNNEPFMAAVHRVADVFPVADIGFFPVDFKGAPRAVQGATEFLKKVVIHNFFPMSLQGINPESIRFAGYLPLRLDQNVYELYNIGEEQEVS